jgi:hypothetical protein
MARTLVLPEATLAGVLSAQLRLRSAICDDRIDPSAFRRRQTIQPEVSVRVLAGQLKNFFKPHGRTLLTRRRAPPPRNLKRRPRPTAKTAKTRGGPRFRKALDANARSRTKAAFGSVAARLKTREGRSHAQQHGVLVGKAVCLDFMRTRIEDLPIVRVSTLVANGYIKARCCDGARPVRRRRRRIRGRCQGAALQERRLLGDACLPAVWRRRAAASAARQ